MELIFWGMQFISNTYLKLHCTPPQRTLIVILHCDTDPEGFSKSPPCQISLVFSLGICLLTFFSGVASLTGGDSMAGRPSEEQPCELDRKWK